MALCHIQNKYAEKPNKIIAGECLVDFTLTMLAGKLLANNFILP